MAWIPPVSTSCPLITVPAFSLPEALVLVAFIFVVTKYLTKRNFGEENAFLITVLWVEERLYVAGHIVVADGKQRLCLNRNQ